MLIPPKPAPLDEAALADILSLYQAATDLALGGDSSAAHRKRSEAATELPALIATVRHYSARADAAEAYVDELLVTISGLPSHQVSCDCGRDEQCALHATIERLTAERDALRTAWVPVSERAPEIEPGNVHSAEVQLWLVGDGHAVGRYYEPYGRWPGYWKVAYSDLSVGVTLWQPLPAPPAPHPANG